MEYLKQPNEKSPEQQGYSRATEGEHYQLDLPVTKASKLRPRGKALNSRATAGLQQGYSREILPGRTPCHQSQ